MAQTPLTLRQWKRAEYERLVELGVFDREAVERIGGQLIVAEPQHTHHAVGVGKAADALADYWILNVVERVVEIYREPQPDASAPYGWNYAATTRLAPPAVIAPLALPSLRIAVSDLLPR